MVLLLRPHASQPDILGVCGTALIFGAGLVSISSFCLGFLIQGVPLRCAVTGICLGMAGYAWKRRGWALPAFARLRFTAPRAIALALVTAQVGFVTWLSLYRESLGWDGLFNWESKAKVAFLNGGAIPLQYYTSNYDFFHRSYPPLVPLLEAWIYGFLGRMDQSTIKLIGPYFYLAAALLLVSVANRTREWRWSGIFVLLPFVLVPALAMGQGSASSGYADFPLSAVYVCAVIYCVEHWRTRSVESARMLGLSAALHRFHQDRWHCPASVPRGCNCSFGCEGAELETGCVGNPPRFGLWLGWSAFLRSLGVPRRSGFRALHAGRFPVSCRPGWTAAGLDDGRTDSAETLEPAVAAGGGGALLSDPRQREMAMVSLGRDGMFASVAVSVYLLLQRLEPG